MKGFCLASMRCLCIVGVVLSVLMTDVALAAPAEGSETGQGPAGFRFSSPRSSFSLRGGFTFNRASSDIYDFFIDELTIERSDFNAPTFAADFGWNLNERVDLVLGIEYGRASVRSENRDYVDQDDIPIVQDTRLTQVPLTLSVRFYLTPRGRSVSQYAWVPSTAAIYVGGGGGATWYRLEQFGEFVDFRDLVIFEDNFVSDGWTIAGHAFAGVDLKLTSSIGLILEGRYQFASHDMTGSFLGFEPIDLNGLRLMAGISFKI